VSAVLAVLAVTTLWSPASMRHAGAAASSNALPAFARKYGVNCTTCHWPVSPKLNGFGLLFRWRGYRMVDELNKSLKVDDVKNHLAARGIVAYEYAKTNGEPTELAEFTLPTLSLFYVGSFGKNYGAWFELGYSGDVLVQLQGVWGKEKTFGGVRGGEFLWLAETGLAGFDRVVTPTGPLVIEEPLTDQVPFTLGGQKLGLESYFVVANTRFSAMVLNGYNLDNGLTEDKSKDFALTAQHLFDMRGSGITALAYRGSMNTRPDDDAPIDAYYTRFALSGNYIFSNLELAVGGALARDYGYVADGSVGKGWGWWGSVLYNFPRTPLHTNIALNARYEYLNSNTDATGIAVNRYYFGFAAPVTNPMYLRLRGEYYYDHRGDGSNSNGLAIQADLAW
jgi:hypothetical protein